MNEKMELSVKFSVDLTEKDYDELTDFLESLNTLPDDSDWTIEEQLLDILDENGKNCLENLKLIRNKLKKYFG